MSLTLKGRDGQLSLWIVLHSSSWRSSHLLSRSSNYTHAEDLHSSFSFKTFRGDSITVCSMGKGIAGKLRFLSPRKCPVVSSRGFVRDGTRGAAWDSEPQKELKPRKGPELQDEHRGSGLSIFLPVSRKTCLFLPEQTSLGSVPALIYYFNSIAVLVKYVKHLWIESCGRHYGN